MKDAVNCFLKPNGEYQVGATNLEIIDHDRTDVNGNPQEIKRIPVRIFYPTKENTGNYENYLLEPMRKPVVKAFWCKAFEDANLMTYCQKDVAPAEGCFPVVLYNHGLNGFLEQNTVLCSDLAASGFVVVSISHPKEAAAVQYADGTFEFYEKTINQRVVSPAFAGYREQMKIFRCKEEPEAVLQRFDAFQKKYCSLLIQRVSEWHRDSMAVLHALMEKQKDEDWLLAGELDFLHTGAIGHSLGGSTALHLLSEPEIRCAVNMDGAVFGDHNGADFQKPTLTLCCRENKNVELGGFLHNSGPSFVASFEKMKHTGFMDIKYFPGSKMTLGEANPLVVREAVSEYHKEFLSRYLTEQPWEGQWKTFDGY